MSEDLVYDEQRLDRWHDDPREDDEQPSRADLAGDHGAFTAFAENYGSGYIRTTGALLPAALCERRPDERLSACVLEADHAGGCLLVRLTRDRHGAAFYRIPAGSPTPVQVHEMRTRYREPTRLELAEEVAWLVLFTPDHLITKEPTP